MLEPGIVVNDVLDMEATPEYNRRYRIEGIGHFSYGQYKIEAISITDIGQGRLTEPEGDYYAEPPPLMSSSCTTLNDFTDAVDLVNAECCDEPSEDCSTGYPATCNSGCATVLLTVQNECNDFLSNTAAMKPVKAAIDAAAATCLVRRCRPCCAFPMHATGMYDPLP